MKERELGSMQIAGERIRVVEKGLSADDSAQQAYIHIYHNETGELLPDGSDLPDTVCSWWAYADEGRIVASGALHAVEEEGTVEAWVYVIESYRRLGIGRFMIRLATDQAIRYRKRSIVVPICHAGLAHPKNEFWLKILDEEDFEKQPEQHPGFTFLKKELRWT